MIDFGYFREEKRISVNFYYLLSILELQALNNVETHSSANKAPSAPFWWTFHSLQPSNTLMCIDYAIVLSLLLSPSVDTAFVVTIVG